MSGSLRVTAASRNHYTNSHTDWKISWNREWNACTKVGLMHHVLLAIHEPVLVLQQMFNDHKDAFPQALKRHFGSPGVLHTLAPFCVDRFLGPLSSQVANR